MATCQRYTTDDDIVITEEDLTIEPIVIEIPDINFDLDQESVNS